MAVIVLRFWILARTSLTDFLKGSACPVIHLTRPLAFIIQIFLPYVLRRRRLY